MMAEKIIEHEIIERFTRHFQVPPHRVNRVHEADAELADPGPDSSHFIAMTTDGVIEEIASGLYDDPYLMGWMLATVNLSDLAAVGADPIGLLVSINIPSVKDRAFTGELSRGINDACLQAGTFIMGGDTNASEAIFLCGCGLGLVPKNKYITRKGARPGEKCYLTGPAGIGGVFAYLKFTGEASRLPPHFYRPAARIREGKLIRQFASCCMDTSDGVIHTVDTLMRVNECSFILSDTWERTLHPAVLQICRAQNMPAWITLAGVHGEFELFFTVPAEKEAELLEAAEKIDWKPVCVGTVGRGRNVSIQSGEKRIPVDTGRIRNLSENAGFDQKSYINGLLEIAAGIDHEMKGRRSE